MYIFSVCLCVCVVLCTAPFQCNARTAERIFLIISCMPLLLVIRCERQDTHRHEQVLSLYLVFVRRSREGSLYYPLVFELSEREGALQCILEPLEAGLQTSRLQTLDEVGRLD